MRWKIKSQAHNKSEQRIFVPTGGRSSYKPAKGIHAQSGNSRDRLGAEKGNIGGVHSLK